MNSALLWLLVAFGLTVVVVRRRSVAVALVTGQALILVGVALYDARGELVGITTVSGRPKERAALADAVCQAAGHDENAGTGQIGNNGHSPIMLTTISASGCGSCPRHSSSATCGI